MSSRAYNDQVFEIGDFACRVLHDGSRSIGSMTSGSAKSFIFGDARGAELDACLRSYGGFESSTVLPFNYLLVKYDDQITLLDTGCGGQAENEKHPDEPAGLLLNSLTESGLRTDEVDTVIVSHCHWDHFGGAVSDGKVAFQKAKYVMSKMEADHIRVNVKGWALNYLNLIEDNTMFVTDETEVSPGITVKPAPGHTPGIIVAEVSSGGESLLYMSDLVIHQAHIEHANWIPAFETNRVAAEASRRGLIEDSYRRNLLLFVPHIPSSLGRIAHSNAGYYWVNEHI